MIEKQKLKKIAALANIHIPDESLGAAAKDFNELLSLADKLAGFKGGDNLFPAHEMRFADLRKDEIGESLPREKLLSNAPESAAGCFVVPDAAE